VKEHRHIPALDGIRGMAVLLVILFHFFNAGFGWIGVDLFFVLSGFLITGILIDSRDDRNYFRNFYIRRTLRIFPLYYFAFTFFLLLVIFAEDAVALKEPDFFTANALWFYIYMQNWLFAITGWPADHVLNHFWSLAIEEQFYIFWPVLVYFIPPKKLLHACILIIVVSLVSRICSYYQGCQAPWQFVTTHCRLEGLATGGLIAVLFRKNLSSLINIFKWVGWIMIPVIIFLYIKAGTLKYNSPYYLTIGFTIFDLFLGSVLVAALTRKAAITIFSWPVLRFLGKYSYGIYVYHWMIYQLLWKWYLDHILNGINAGGSRFVYGIVCFILTILVSRISYMYLESPLLELKKKFAPAQPAVSH
jgi:peptidoglycan/LPS O-acetylase OafA/YrhL